MKDDGIKFFIIVSQLAIIAILIYSIVFSNLADKIIAGVETKLYSGNVAVIPIKGDILVDTYDFSGYASSDDIVPIIEKASNSPGIKAIIFDINSRGGSPVGSIEIADAIKASNKTTVSWVRENAQSGGYYIASTTDWIIANKESDVGSLGVIVQYEIFNVTYETVKSGKFKDMFTDNRLLTDEERRIAQETIDASHKSFVNDIASNRGMDSDVIAGLANGLTWTGVKAKELGLVDEIGSKREVLDYLRAQIGGEPSIVYYNKKTQDFDLQYPSSPTEDDG